VVARVTITPEQGLVGPIWQVDYGVHPYRPHLLPEPGSTQGLLASASPDGDSDVCKVEPGRGS
jgi:hypothetical protein